MPNTLRNFGQLAPAPATAPITFGQSRATFGVFGTLRTHGSQHACKDLSAPKPFRTLASVLRHRPRA
eukprot:15458194-Alexandrium_andersonii.AAC.1